MLLNMLLVALGGALGSVLRYGVTRASAVILGTGFPWGTVIVNITGSFAIGFLSAYLIAKFDNNELFQRLIITGLLGGFTTFSAFSFDFLDLAGRGTYGQAIFYLLISVVPAIIATFLGLAIARALL